MDVAPPAAVALSGQIEAAGAERGELFTAYRSWPDVRAWCVGTHVDLVATLGAGSLGFRPDDPGTDNADLHTGE
jgi:hypothetical protein